MIKRISLHAQGVGAAPTGYAPLRMVVAPSPRDVTRPVNSAPIVNSFAGSIQTGGVYRNGPKARPHILQGWRSPR